ncbi:MAG: hypothetical protein GC179_30165 [Anaerolineaceae bacterium]|nr:hypothetical protein [Anaerolineaceae bacterium]
MAKKKSLTASAKTVTVPWDFLGSQLNNAWEIISANIAAFDSNINLAYLEVSILYYPDEVRGSSSSQTRPPDAEYCVSKGDYELTPSSNLDTSGLPQAVLETASEKLRQFLDKTIDDNFDLLQSGFEGVKKANPDLVSSSVSLQLIVKSNVAVESIPFNLSGLLLATPTQTGQVFTRAKVSCLADPACSSGKRKYKNGVDQGCCKKSN